MQFVGWAILALIVSRLVGALGFTNITNNAASSAKIFFSLFLFTFLTLLAVILLALAVAP